MHTSEFHVVLVDDEPDVHEISRLAMRQFRVYGLPVRLHSAYSKAEGIEVLNKLTLGRPSISLASMALIDVVMETDHAGLELCDHIRNVMKNRCLQIVVRTGQPGVAPERSVIDRYDIQGYVAKSEATEDKLYTLVKAGIREAYYSALSNALQDLIRYLIPASTRSEIKDALHRWEKLARVDTGGHKASSITSSLCYYADGEFVVGVEQFADAAVAAQRVSELKALPGETLNEDGDRYIIDGHDLLIEIAPTAISASLHYLLRGTATPPDWEVFLYHRYLRSFSALWKRAG